eukprot:TRINITY_DN13218_c0_g1_i1.p1 TRINITY_DN13218_c0_g1~~TRINITY_DN13218_c0_g1_i1.p1  ORF type:complete len:257 (-),score=55.36 TRINITY_DN13218_c0_g1_i1:24-749(-)
MTQQLYWNDTYLFNASANLLEVGTTGETDFVVLDATIFYPQGGGQPCDTGSISTANSTFEVTDVRMVSGKVMHYGKWTGDKLEAGTGVDLSINKERRILNSRIHTAGHLLDNVVKDLGLDWVPGKGYHFPSGPYVEYAGVVPADKRPEVLLKIQEGLNGATEQATPILVEMVDYDEVAGKCGGVCPDYLPVGKEARIVSINGLGCPCAGTHVNNTSEIGTVKITKITYKKNIVRVSYSLDK